MADMYHKRSWLYFQKEQYKDAGGNALQALALSRDIKYTEGKCNNPVTACYEKRYAGTFIFIDNP